MRKYKVLIFPAGTEIAFEIQNALKYSKFVELYGGSSVSSHADFVFKKCINGFPFVNEDGFIEYLNDVIDKYDIDYIYPAHDSALLTLTEKKNEIHATVVTSTLETVQICRSKNKTYEFFQGASYIPVFYTDIKQINKFPVFVKPAVGQGSNGAEIINNHEELEHKLSDGVEYSICEYLPGEEYTVDCFTDRNGTLRACHIRSRERIRTGISVRSRLLNSDSRVNEIAEDINNKLIFNGAWFFQLKKNNKGEYILMEISPRIPGTMAVSRSLGINYPLLTLYNMWGYDVSVLENGYDVLLDRAFISRYKTNVEYKTVYLDFDDTVYIDDSINLELIKFLYQCVNKKKNIILLSKHDGDIESALHKYKISKSLFNQIIHIDKDSNKSEYITEKDSIFIDDSFSERKLVHEKFGIPVFDLDMIESLIDWRM